jgi:Flp pilus assembly protein TadD
MALTRSGSVGMAKTGIGLDDTGRAGEARGEDHADPPLAQQASFDAAVRALRAGRLDDAERTCQDILQASPTHDGTLNALGIIALMRGQGGLARDFLRRAIALDPSNAAYHVNLAKVLNALGRVAEAEGHYRDAIRLGPNEVDGRIGLAHMLRAQRRHDEAASCFADAVKLRPDDPELRGVYANVLQDLGRRAEAETQYLEVCRFRPDYPEVLNNLGNLVQADRRLEEAEAYFRRAVALRPDLAAAWNNLGNVLRECNRAAEAQSCCREALRLWPDYAMAHNNLANALKESDDYEAAEFHYREAVRLKPDHAEAYNNLGVLFGDRGQLREAEGFYRKAIELRQDYDEARSNLGMTLLGAGKYAEGWGVYDAYRKIGERRDLAGPRWDGTDLGGRPLFVYAEQGFGDVIQFCRFVPFIGTRARVILEVPRDLLDLLANLPGVDDIVARGDPLPPYHAHCALMSLPRWLGIAAQRLRGDAPYLSADRTRVVKWRNRVEALPGLRVGLAWAGNPRLANDRRRSIDPERLNALADIAGVSFVSLQKGMGTALAAGRPSGLAMADWTAELADFADTAALIATLDLVIAVDTSVAHLAGALGRPVWLLNRFNSCWRWLHDRTRSPWYATLRQFKQTQPGDWDGVLGQVREALLQQVARVPPSRAFEEALGHHRAGRLELAEATYRRLLAADPRHAGALHHLGLVHFQSSRHELAVEHIARAIDLEPQNGNAHHGLASALNALGRHDAAEDHYRTALRLKPDLVEALSGLGLMLLDLGRLDEADAHLREAHRLSPGSEITCNNLGIVLCRRDRLTEAEANFREALRLNPEFAAAHANVGSIVRLRGELDEAEAHCRRALALNADFAEGHFVLAQTLEGGERFADAERSYREALRLKPQSADWCNDLAKLLIEQRRLPEARSLIEETLRLRPDHPEAHSNLAIMLLLSGDHDKGWQEYEWRWRLKKRLGRLGDFVQPVWGGENIDGRTLLIHAEQGFGDTVQFCRLVCGLDTGARVVLEVQPALVALLADLPGVDQIVARGDPLPHFDVHCPLLSLPRVLAAPLTRSAGPVPYLSADPARVAKWRDRVSRLPGMRVGVAWAGSPTMADDRRRSIAPERLAVLADVAGVSLVSLQKSPAGERQHESLGFALHDWTDELCDFADTAALITSLDLVISVDTAVVHVAGALGRPVWLLNRFSGCWRWLLDREDSPWYPSLRQFRQPQPGDWDHVLANVRSALQVRVAENAPAASRARRRA